MLVCGAALFLAACSDTASYNAAHFEYTPQTFAKLNPDRADISKAMGQISGWLDERKAIYQSGTVNPNSHVFLSLK